MDVGDVSPRDYVDRGKSFSPREKSRAKDGLCDRELHTEHSYSQFHIYVSYRFIVGVPFLSVSLSLNRKYEDFGAEKKTM